MYISGGWPKLNETRTDYELTQKNKYSDFRGNALLRLFQQNVYSSDAKESA